MAECSGPWDPASVVWPPPQDPVHWAMDTAWWASSWQDWQSWWVEAVTAQPAGSWGVVGVVSIVIVIFLLGFVVPQVVSAFSQARQDLPALTRELRVTFENNDKAVFVMKVLGPLTAT